jgi:F0F1-type ATP synthase membrane subunit b/b'
MAQLNLTPDPIVIGAQAAIFLANMIVVKKLILEPYLTVRSRREASTGGSQDEAQALLKEADALGDKITSRMRAAHKDAATTRDKIKSDAMTKRAALLAQAETEAKKEQARILSEIETNLKEERSRKDATIKEIAEGFFAQVTH